MTFAGPAAAGLPANGLPPSRRPKPRRGDKARVAVACFASPADKGGRDAIHPPRSAGGSRRADVFLSSDQVSENCMTLSELDGFLAGILASPELIPPSEWIPCIWGDDEPAFNDLDAEAACGGQAALHPLTLARDQPALCSDLNGLGLVR